MNRGSLPGVPRLLADGHPSMRPRFMNRGSDVGQSERGGARAAFNEAPIHESGKYVPARAGAGATVSLQ